MSSWNWDQEVNEAMNRMEADEFLSGFGDHSPDPVGWLFKMLLKLIGFLIMGLIGIFFKRS